MGNKLITPLYKTAGNIFSSLLLLTKISYKSLNEAAGRKRVGDTKVILKSRFWKTPKPANIV